MRIALLALLAAPLLLPGCNQDPIDRPGSWQATGANDANLRAMAADPAHLERGVGSDTNWGAPAARAITQTAAGRRPALVSSPATPFINIVTGGGGAGGAGGGR